MVYIPMHQYYGKQRLDVIKLKNNDYYYKFGFDAFGPVLLGFCRWIHEYKEKNKLNKLFFLSRDGKIVKKAYDILYNNEVDNGYFHTSRRAMIVPSLKDLKSYEEIFERIAFNKKMKLETFIKKVGLEDYDLNILLEKYDLKKTDIINIEKYIENEKFKNFLIEILPIVKSNALKEYEAFKKYANNNDFSGKIGIIDIGWYGTMQKAIESLNMDVEIHGLYVGMVPKNKLCNLKFAKGFLFDDEHGLDLYKKFHYFISIFEFMFLAQEGSTKCYKDNIDGYVLYDYEYVDLKEKEYAFSIQCGAIDYIKKNKTINIKSPKICTKALIKRMLYPSIRDSKAFGNLLFLDDEKTYIAKPEALYKYVFNLKKLKKDFINSSWRIGFLKRLFVLKLPYYKINEILRNVFIKERK